MDTYKTLPMTSNYELEKVIADLAADEWKRGSVCSHDRFSQVFYKRFRDVRPNCYLNEDKPGVQIQLQLWDFRKYWSPISPADIGFTVELQACGKDDVSIRINSGSMTPQTVVRDIKPRCQQLIRAWQASQEGIIPVGRDDGT